MLHADIIRHYLPKYQGIAEFISHLPNRPVKKITHMGEKLKDEAERRGLKPVDVAAVFDVAPPSVYDWYQHGRIHKKHYPKLETWSGKSIHWWLDFPQNHHIAGESPAPPYADEDPRHKDLIDLFDSLPGAEQNQLLADLREKKEHYDAVIDELLKRRQSG